MTSRIESHAADFGRILLVKLAPNQDLSEGLEAACRHHGVSHAVLRGAIGSLTDAVLETPDGNRIAVAGPGLEVVMLAGQVEPDATGRPCATLYGAVAERDGTVRGGQLSRGENAICITAEIVLQEWAPSAITTPNDR